MKYTISFLILLVLSDNTYCQNLHENKYLNSLLHYNESILNVLTKEEVEFIKKVKVIELQEVDKIYSEKIGNEKIVNISKNIELVVLSSQLAKIISVNTELENYYNYFNDIVLNVDYNILPDERILKNDEIEKLENLLNKDYAWVGFHSKIWFILLHEISHLKNDDSKTKKNLFSKLKKKNSDEINRSLKKIELDADKWAHDILNRFRIPLTIYYDVLSMPICNNELWEIKYNQTPNFLERISQIWKVEDNSDLNKFNTDSTVTSFKIALEEIKSDIENSNITYEEYIDYLIEEDIYSAVGDAYFYGYLGQEKDISKAIKYYIKYIDYKENNFEKKIKKTKKQFHNLIERYLKNETKNNERVCLKIATYYEYVEVNSSFAIKYYTLAKENSEFLPKRFYERKIALLIK